MKKKKQVLSTMIEAVVKIVAKIITTQRLLSLIYKLHAVSSVTILTPLGALWDQYLHQLQESFCFLLNAAP